MYVTSVYAFACLVACDNRHSTAHFGNLNCSDVIPLLASPLLAGIAEVLDGNKAYINTNTHPPPLPPSPHPFYCLLA